MAKIEVNKKTSLLIISIIMIILGVLIAIIGWYIFPVCGATMTCGYTQKAETAIGSLLVLVGVLLLFTKTSEAMILGSGVGIGLGTITILLPTYIIGMCSMSTMLCRETTEPALILLGAATIIVSAAGIVKHLLSKK